MLKLILVTMDVNGIIHRKFSSCLMALLMVTAYHASAQESCDCPAVWECGACADGLTTLSLKYTRPGSSAVAIKVDDQQATVFDSTIFPGDTIVLNGSLSNGKFVGNRLFIQENGELKLTINISCENPIYFKSAFDGFTVVDGRSKNGGRLCCDPATLERVPPVFAECPADITQPTDATAEVPVHWPIPTASDLCGEPRITSTHEPGDLFPVGSTAVVYTATDRSGNTATCTFQVHIYGDVDLQPTTIVTPDGDGVNDEWLLSDVGKYPNNHVTIVDRWGSVIFAASGYDNDNVVWKGRNASGVIVPTGTYFYAITVRLGSSTVEKRGFIELIRSR